MKLNPLLASAAAFPALSLQSQSRPAPKVALVGLDAATNDAIHRAFSECAVKTVEINEAFADLVKTEKFEGCALRLDEQAPSILKAIRSSPSNSRMIVYGIGSEDLDVRPFSAYGVNAILDLPLDRTAAVRTARSTCALLLQELRRYVRIPLVTDVNIETGANRIRGSSREISGGGMSVHLRGEAPAERRVRLVFTLPGKALIRISAAPCWKHGSLMGFQFEDSDRSRETVKSWIESFLRVQ